MALLAGVGPSAMRDVPFASRARISHGSCDANPQKRPPQRALLSVFPAPPQGQSYPAVVLHLARAPRPAVSRGVALAGWSASWHTFAATSMATQRHAVNTRQNCTIQLDHAHNTMNHGLAGGFLNCSRGISSSLSESSPTFLSRSI